MGCAFQCAYCFARHRGGNSGDEVVRPADPDTIVRRFEYAEKVPPSPKNGMITQCLNKRVPIHFGGMSDPFQPAEKRYGVTKKVLKKLSDINYPTVISTKSPLVAKNEYLQVVSNNENIVVQFSLSTTNDKKSGKIESKDISPNKILKSAEKLSKKGVPVTIRWQPYIIGISENPRDFCSVVSKAGVKHLALEHLKVPLDKKKELWNKLEKESKSKIVKKYKEMGSYIDGRELVLEPKIKVQNIISTKQEANKRSMTFGAADNEFQYMSDTFCCCSGVDQFDGFENWNKFQISHAVKRNIGKKVKFSTISNKWRPIGSVDRYLNSNSRIGSEEGKNGKIKEHIKKRWNNETSNMSPSSF
jgi:DNA repair photolyase